MAPNNQTPYVKGRWFVLSQRCNLHPDVSSELNFSGVQFAWALGFAAKSTFPEAARCVSQSSMVL